MKGPKRRISALADGPVGRGGARMRGAAATGLLLLVIIVLIALASQPIGLGGSAEPPTSGVAGAQQGPDVAQQVQATFATVPDLAFTADIAEPFIAQSPTTPDAQAVGIDVIAAHLGMVSTGERLTVVIPDDLVEIARAGPVLIAATWTDGLNPDELRADSIVALGSSPQSVLLPPEWSAVMPEVTIDTWVISLLEGQGGTAELRDAVGCGACGGAPPLLAFGADSVASAMRSAGALATEALLHR